MTGRPAAVEALREPQEARVADHVAAPQVGSLDADQVNGHALAMPVYMDRDLTAFDIVWAAAGRPDAVFAITPTRLVELSGARLEALT